MNHYGPIDLRQVEAERELRRRQHEAERMELWKRQELDRQMQERRQESMDREIPIFDRGYKALGIEPRGGNVDIGKGSSHHTVYGTGPDSVDYRVSWNQHQDGSTNKRHINEQRPGKERPVADF